VGQLELLEQARGLGLDLSGRQSPQAGDKLQMLSARHLHIQSSFLHGDADRTPHNLGLGEHIVPGYPRRAISGAGQGGEDPYHSRLPRAVAAEVGEDLTIAHLERRTLQSPYLTPVRLAQTACLNSFLHLCSSHPKNK
jgi:hypothetical protein